MPFNASFFKFYKFQIALMLTSFLFYWSFAYDLHRTDYVKLIGLYVALYFLFYKIMQLAKHDLKLLTWLAFGFRAVFILAIPNLSQDFYRFIWDGRLILEGFNPYLYTPEFFISKGEFPVAQAQELYQGMGRLSAGHYTNYPPLNQLCFVIAGLFAGKSILGSAIVLRLIIITADFGTLYFGKKLLEKLKLPAHNIFWYILNPFIIIELTGNLHFEGVMIFFLVWSLYLLYSRKWQLAAVVFSLSVSVKLIPLIFLPLFYQWFIKRKGVNSELLGKVQDEIIVNVIANPDNYSDKPSLSNQQNSDEQTSQVLKTCEVSTKASVKKLLGFYTIIGFTTILLFLPFYSTEFVINYTQTVALWFQNFEFNASLYYIFREIGYWFRGWNEIAIIGKIISLLVLLSVFALALFRKNKAMVELITAMLFVLSFYYFASTTVHPWYVATLLMLSVFTKYKFPLVWSFVIILSYLAYTNNDNSENLWIIALEYVIVYAVFIWEVFIKKANSKELA